MRGRGGGVCRVGDQLNGHHRRFGFPLVAVPVDAARVWTYYRDGDATALSQAIGPAPAYPHAAELTAHLEALLDRSRSGHPRHLDSLLPRLQSECATPQPLAELRAACSRAQDRW